MSETFEICSASGNYAITIDIDSITTPRDSLGGEQIKLIDEKVKSLWPRVASESAIGIEALEGNKNLETVALLIERLRDEGANRKTHLYAYGGGIVQDLSTFIASSYMRGIDWTYCPTTLLGMVDSCIGGKSSLNVGRYKNIAGNFYPPKAVLIDCNFCQTLSKEERIAGLCEAVKICFAAQGSQFERYLEIANLESDALSVLQLQSIISLSLRTKKVFIEEDEFDQGIRLLLNFGHTFGHAIEAGTNFAITHGVAVGLGMLAELEFSKAYFPLHKTPPRIASLIGYLQKLLLQLPLLKKQLSSLSMEDAYASFMSDKKHDSTHYYLILADESGCLKREAIAKSEHINSLIKTIFSKLKAGAFL